MLSIRHRMKKWGFDILGFDLREVNILLLSLLPLFLIFSRTIAEVIVAFIGLSFLIVRARQHAWRDMTTGCVGILLLIWVVLNAIVSPQALNPEISFTRSLPWIRFVLFYAATTLWLLRSLQDLKTVLIFWSVILGLSILDGAVQMATGVSLSGHDLPSNRVTGPLDRPNLARFVAYLGLPILGIAFLIRECQSWSWKPSMRVIFICMGVYAFILLSGERAVMILTCVWAVLATGFVIVFVPAMRKWAFLSLLFVLALPVFLLQTVQRVAHRGAFFVEEVSDFWESAYGQLIEAGWNLWMAHPITGIGLKNFREADFPPPIEDIGGLIHPHNIYIEWLCETGLVGFIGFLAFILVFVRPIFDLIRKWPERCLTGLALTGGVIVMLSPLSATQSFFSNWPAILTWSGLGVIAATTRLARDSFQEHAVKRS